MNKIRTHKAVNFNIVLVVLVTMTISFSIVPGFVSKVYSRDGAAFLGGMVAGHVIGGAVRRSRIRTAAAVNESYGQPVAASVAQPTAQQKLDQLNKLAAGGYITPAEFKAKKKAILDGM